MIHDNRGVDLLGQKRFAEAATVNAKALRLDPANATARGNLLATLNNWAISLGTAGRHAEAARLLEHGIAMDPAYALFRTNYLHVHREWVEALLGEDRAAPGSGRNPLSAPHGFTPKNPTSAKPSTKSRGLPVHARGFLRSASLATAARSLALTAR